MLATAAQVIAILGLVIGFVAGILMYYFPATTVRYTDKGEGEITLVSNPSEEGKRKGRIQLFFSKAAPWLLALAFLFQLPTLVLPLLPEVASQTQSGRQANDPLDAMVACSFRDAGLSFLPTDVILKVSIKTRSALNLSFIPPRRGSRSEEHTSELQSQR